MQGSHQSSKEHGRYLTIHWSWIALITVFLSLTFIVVRACTPVITNVEYIFPDGFTGPTKIKLDESAPDLEWNRNTLLVRFDSAGNVSANGDDYDRLRGVKMEVYRYENGKAINLYMPQTGQETKGSWFESLGQHMVVDGDVATSEELSGRIGTVTRS